jgi:hypothetical protein
MNHIYSVSKLFPAKFCLQASVNLLAPCFGARFLKSRNFAGTVLFKICRGKEWLDSMKVTVFASWIRIWQLWDFTTVKKILMSSGVIWQWWCWLVKLLCFSSIFLTWRGTKLPSGRLGKGATCPNLSLKKVYPWKKYINAVYPTRKLHLVVSFLRLGRHQVRRSSKEFSKKSARY